MKRSKLLFRIRAMILVFVIMLILSGITAFPVYTEMKWLMDQHFFSRDSLVGAWLYKVWLAVADMNDKHHFLFYGYDWLAFAHIIIGMAFVGPLKDPIRNKWIIDWGILSCIAVLPLAFIAGSIRSIPWFHILIDCSFGVIGIFPLMLVRKWIRQLEHVLPE